MSRAAKAWIVASAGLVLGGCAGGRPQETGIRIGDETLKQFEAGVTTEAWLLAILGPPTSAAVVEGVENTRVYRYTTGEAGGGLASVFSGKGGRNTSVVYFILTDGIVTRFWADREVRSGMLGGSREGPLGEKG